MKRAGAPSPSSGGRTGGCPGAEQEVYVETTIDRSVLEELRAGLQGAAHVVGEDGYDEGRQAFNLNGHQHPALVVMAAGAADGNAPGGPARGQGVGVGG